MTDTHSKRERRKIKMAEAAEATAGSLYFRGLGDIGSFCQGTEVWHFRNIQPAGQCRSKGESVAGPVSTL